MIELDGATGEGGGQILRSGLALAMCTGQPLRVLRIRAKRAKPGLMRQHLACVRAAQQVCGAAVVGAELGSQTLDFVPGPVQAGDYAFAVGSAGSCTLVLQTVLPALMLAGAPSRVRLSGGTHNPMAPPYHFIERCFVPLLQRLGVGLALTLRRHGFYPAGGGEVEVCITPAAAGLQPFDLLQRGPVLAGYAEALVAGLPRHIAERELQVVAQELGWAEEQLRVPALRQNEGPGNALLLTLGYAQVTELCTAFGEKDVSAERVARRCVAEAQRYLHSEGALGPHLADQWMLPLALAVHQTGTAAAYTCTELTEHASTNLQVLQRFLPIRATALAEGAHWRISLSSAC